MANISITVGTDEVVATGTVTLFVGESAFLRLRDDREEITVEITVSLVPNEPHSVQPIAVSPQHLKIVLKNWGVGVAAVQPSHALTGRYPIGTLSGRHLWVSLGVIGIGTARIVAYTLTLSGG